MRPVLDEWVKESHRFRKILHDLPWWYNERANVGLLAAAAARKNWICCEEFRTSKHGPIVEGGKNLGRYGRCDLYLASATGKNGFAIEAKHVWQAIGRRSAGSYRRLDSAWKATWASVGALKADEAEVRLGALFIVPRFLVPADVSIRDTLIDEAFDDLIKSVSAMPKLAGLASAWMSPSERARFDWGKGAKDVYPGCILALRVRSKAAKRG